MGTGYTRNDTSNNIADGNVINASDLDGEYDAIESAFGTSGHTHDGTSGEGGPVTVLGPVQDFVVTASVIKPKTDNTLDIGTSALEFKDLYLDGLAYIDGLGETMLVATDKAIQFRDTAISINSSTDGQLDIDADTEIEITSPTVDINASTVVNISTDLIVGDDLTLQSDAAVLNFGADSDVSLTHVADTGLLLNAGSAIQFRDSALAINSSADGQLDIIADTQLEITTPTLELNSDSQIIAIGADGDVTITHEADTGLKMKAASGFELNLQTGDTSVESGNVLGKITFNAPSEDSGSDAILDGAAIEAVAEGTFSSTVNTTKLSFKTGASEAATEKMSLSSGGALDVTGDITGSTLNADGDTSAGDNAAIGYTSTEGLILTGQGSTNDVTIKNDADADVIEIPTGTTNVSFAGPIAVGQNSFSGGSVIADFHTSGSAVGTQLSFANDHNTSAFQLGLAGNTSGDVIFYNNANTDMDFYTNNSLRFSITNSEVVVNDSSADVDFRVESDGNANMINVDAGNDRVGIGMIPDTTVLTVNGQIGTTNGSASAPTHSFYSDADTGMFRTAANTIGFATAGTERVQIGSFGVAADAITNKTASGGITIDVAGDLVVNADGGNLVFQDGSDNIGELANHSGDFGVNALGQDKDILFKGNMSGTTTTALKLDMSNLGFATFNSSATFNETSNDVDFRIEGANFSNVFFVDASIDDIGIRTSTPSSNASISVFGEGSANYNGMSIRSSDSDNTNKGGVAILGSQKASANDLWTGVGFWDDGTNRLITYGGGGWGNQEATKHSFYAGSYDAGSGNAPERFTVNLGETVVNDASNDYDFRVESNDNTHIIFADADTNRVGIGTSAPTQILEVKTSASPTIELNQNDTYRGAIRLAGNDLELRNSSGVMDFFVGTDNDHESNSTRAMMLNNSGNLLMGATSTFDTQDNSNTSNSRFGYISPALHLEANGTAPLQLKRNSGDGPIIAFNRGGQTGVGSISVTSSATAFNTSSDYRLKENVSYDWDATSRLKQLKPARFNFKADKDVTVDGFLAHEVSSIVPEAITGKKDATEKYTDEDGVEKTKDVYQGIDQSKLVPLLVKTIQELEARIAKLEGE